MLNAVSELVYADVVAELKSDPRVDASNISVAVDDDVVRLTGSVPHLNDKWAAEEAAKRVKGVKAVVLDIEVDLPATHRRNDMDIARALADALYWDVSVPESVQATVQDADVTLTGEAEWNYQREEAAQVARRIAGVRSILNRIALKPPLSQSDIRSEIQRNFHRNAQIDANGIRVTCEGSKVTLTGTVHSCFERDEAARAAWSVKGVTAVDDRITVVT